MHTSFNELSLIEPLRRALADEGYTTPTPIQSATIPAAIDGRDILGCAQTGTGKTAAFVLPILQRLAATTPTAGRSGGRTHDRTTERSGARPQPRPIRALILSPTRELATQIGESVATYGRHLRISHTVIFGGVGQNPQVTALRRGVDVVVATPGRLIDLLDQRHLRLDGVEIFVLDEADRMLDMGFIAPIRRIASTLPKRRQTMLFSATMPKPIAELAESLLSDPLRVAVTPVASTVDRITQSMLMVGRGQKQARLESLLTEHDVRRAVVFTKTKHGADRVTRKLTQAGITATAIHGNKAQNQRERALAAFRDGRARVLVATDVAARGLDVDGISHVFNFDLPMEPEAYVHRIGRTARAGADGTAISFCDPCPATGELDLLRQIHRLLGSPIPGHDGATIPTLESRGDASVATGGRRQSQRGPGRGGRTTGDRPGGARSGGGRPGGRSESGQASGSERRDGSPTPTKRKKRRSPGTGQGQSTGAGGTPHRGAKPAEATAGAGRTVSGGWARRTSRR